MSLALVSCREEMGRDVKASKADSILFDVGVRMEYDSMLYLANRYEEQGLLSERGSLLPSGALSYVGDLLSQGH